MRTTHILLIIGLSSLASSCTTSPSSSKDPKGQQPAVVQPELLAKMEEVLQRLDAALQKPTSPVADKAADRAATPPAAAVPAGVDEGGGSREAVQQNEVLALLKQQVLGDQLPEISQLLQTLSEPAPEQYFQQTLQQVLKAVQQSEVEGGNNSVEHLTLDKYQNVWQQFLISRRAGNFWNLLQDLKKKGPVSNPSPSVASPQAQASPEASVLHTPSAPSPQAQASPEASVLHTAPSAPSPQAQASRKGYMNGSFHRWSSTVQESNSQVGTSLVLDFGKLVSCCPESHQKVINCALKYLVLFLKDKAPSEVTICNGWLIGLPRIIKNIPGLRILELYDNKLRSLPESLGNLENLQWLGLSKNNLRSLPDSLGKLRNLKGLYLANNGLQSLDKHIFKNLALQVLDLSDNAALPIEQILKTMPKEDLRELYLANNELQSLDEQIFKAMQNLEVLNLSGSPALSIAKIWGNIPKKNLQKLYLAYNQLTYLPPSGANCPNLEELDLSCNPNIRLTQEFFQMLPNLTGLDLGGNELECLPDGIHTLTNLQWINLAGNQLQSLPESIESLLNLTTLNLAGNKFRSLPESIINLPNLQWLDISNIDFQYLPESFMKLVDKYKKGEMEIIGLPTDTEIAQLIAKKQDSLEGKSIEQQPSGAQQPVASSEGAQEETPAAEDAQARAAEAYIKENANDLWSSISVEFYNLYFDFNDNGSNIPQNLRLPVISNIIKYLAMKSKEYNNLSSLSIKNGKLQGELQGKFQNIHRLINLRELDLSGNNLTDLPDLGELQYLQELDLSGNQLKLVSGLGKLQRLQKLYLSNNQLKSVPEIFEESPLQELDLSGNNLPLAQLNVLLKTKKLQQTLQRLYLSDMQLTDVPEFLQESLLEELDLSNNQLTSLPERLGSLKNLNWINLAGNSLTSLPMSFQGLLNNEMTIEGVPEENIQRLIQNAWQQFFTDKNAEQLWNTLKSATSIIALNLSGIDEELRQEVLDKAIEYLVLYKETLQKLDLSNNQLTSLPESLGSLPNMKWINLSGNDALLDNLATPEYQPQLDLLRRLKNRGVDIEGLSDHINKYLPNTEAPPTVSSAVATPSATANQVPISGKTSQTQTSSGT